MQISDDHWIVSDPADGINVIIDPCNDWGDEGLVPTLVVAHYAVTESLSGVRRALDSREYVDAHLAIDGWRDGERAEVHVAQRVPFNRVAFHAGKSKWGGRESVNNFSIGIEVANPGPLVEFAGKLYTTYDKQFKRPWKGPAVRARHKHPLAPSVWTHWAEFTDEEYDVLIHLIELLRQRYPSITDVVGHDDIAPGRKFDPGPCCNVDVIRRAVWPDAA